VSVSAPRHDFDAPPSDRAGGQQRQKVLEVVRRATAPVDALTGSRDWL